MERLLSPAGAYSFVRTVHVHGGCVVPIAHLLKVLQQRSSLAQFNVTTLQFRPALELQVGSPEPPCGHGVASHQRGRRLFGRPLHRADMTIPYPGSARQRLKIVDLAKVRSSAR